MIALQQTKLNAYPVGNLQEVNPESWTYPKIYKLTYFVILAEIFLITININSFSYPDTNYATRVNYYSSTFVRYNGFVTGLHNVLLLIGV